ncbi:MAG: hypothetical protein WAM58_04695 [Candidatus Acidiferrum sp.]
MRRISGLALFLVLAGVLSANEYPQSGTLKAVELADRGTTNCTPGLLAAHCSQEKERHYRIETAEFVMVLKADTPIVQDDPLRSVKVGDPVQFRTDDKGNVWIAAPIDKGRVHKPDHEAKYIVIEKAKP